MDTSIGMKIKTLRLKNNLSQNELCDNIMDRTLLSKIENGRVPPSIAQLEYFANKLNTPISYFFNELNYGDYVDANKNNVNYFLSVLYGNENYEKIIDMVECENNVFNDIKNFNKYFYIGMSYFNMNVKDISTKYLKKYLNSYIKAKEDIQSLEIINFANALNTLSKIMMESNNYSKAAHYLNNARKYLSRYKKYDSLINSIVHNNLGYAYNELNEYTRTIAILEKFLCSNKSLCYLPIMPYIHWALNIAYYNINDYNNSIKHIEKSIYLFSYMNNQAELGRCYMNYINTLRYCNRFDEAYNIIEKCKIDFSNDEALFYKFLTQELVLNFNLNNFQGVLAIHSKIPQIKLCKDNKIDCFFILGHIHYVNENFIEAKKYLNKCINHFIEKNYTYDLSLIYEDLYAITKEERFLKNLSMYKNKTGRKNILA